MSRNDSPKPLWHLLLIDVVSVGGILGLQSMVGATKGDLLIWFFAAGIIAVGVATGYYWFRTVNAVSPAAGADPEGLETLRRENAENLRLLQEDLHNLGQAVLKRLPQRGEASADSVSGSSSSIAASVSTATADLAEVKSTIYEMQAQLDQLNDSLRASAGAPTAPRHIIDDEGGAGAAPEGLGRALAGVAGGAAISRLIANGAPAKQLSDDREPVASTDIEDTHPEGSPEPVSGGDFAIEEPAPAAAVAAESASSEGESDDLEFVGVDETEPTLAAFTPSGTDAETESTLTEQEDDDADWLTAGIAEPDDDAAAPLPVKPSAAMAASQPELLDLDPSDEVRRPRRPAKGETALIAHMMIGIGNKPYLRGIGPGLSIEEGVPMDYVDVGIWQWICPERDVPVILSVWKNDEFPAEGDLMEIEPGEVVEVHPKFDPHH